MKKIVSVLFSLLPLMVTAQLYTVGGSVRYEDPVNPAMEVFLVSTPTTSITYNGTAVGPFQWYRFDTSGTASAISGANSTSLPNIASDMGYFLTSGGNPTGIYAWITNYAATPARFESIEIPDADDICSYVTLNFIENGEDASYYTHTGYRVSILRKFSATYTTLNTDDYSTIEVTEELPVSKKVPAPYKDTSFKVFDSYAQQLGMDVSITYADYRAVAVHAKVTATIEAREADNIVSGGSGGSETYSAPVNATFTSSSNEPVAAFFVWTVYNTSQSTTEPLIRYTDRTLRYTFEQSGKYQVNLDVSDRTFKCSFPTIQLEYEITESFIDIPNVFSPGASPGVNDEFKVAYRSITRFKGIIINRWGQKLFEWKDPAQGWDGRFGGKYVPPGVYFYIIEWEGADGRKGVEKGDINILGSEK